MREEFFIAGVILTCALCTGARRYSDLLTKLNQRNFSVMDRLENGDDSVETTQIGQTSIGVNVNVTTFARHKISKARVIKFKNEMSYLRYRISKYNVTELAKQASPLASRNLQTKRRVIKFAKQNYKKSSRRRHIISKTIISDVPLASHN